MTDKLRKKIVVEFRSKLDRHILRKNAIAQIVENYGIDRSSLYRWCARFGVETK